ncbi:MAG TPA: hypothetical protein VN658_02625 [Candidatus Acidoferrales bacterium]|nr:hypothetical protein [Candidatus Acidoferrales bacterium]
MSGKTVIWCSKHETFSADERKSWALLKGLVAECKVETRELPDGYAFRLQGSDSLIANLAEWVSYESRCCPFFNFEIAFQRNSGPTWLRIWGGEGVKDFVNNLTILRHRGARNGNCATEAAAQPAPICCNSNAFTATQKSRYTELNAKINGAREETKMLPNGYTYRLLKGAVSLPELAEWVLLERLCCPFLDFAIQVEQDNGTLWVALTGIPDTAQIVHPNY